MNDIIHKENFFVKIQKILKENVRLLGICIFCFILLIAIFQFYLVNKNNKILKTSINYNLAFSKNLNSDQEDIINNISKENNFYGFIATLNKIQFLLNKNEIDAAYDHYIVLLNQKKISNTYKTSIAIHASYLFLDQLKYFEISNASLENNLDILEKVNSFLLFIDPSLDSYEGFKLEILYLILIGEQESKKNKMINEKIINLYNQIQNNDKIPSSIKERVKKIHEFQKYK